MKLSNFWGGRDASLTRTRNAKVLLTPFAAAAAQQICSQKTCSLEITPTQIGRRYPYRRRRLSHASAPPLLSSVSPQIRSPVAPAPKTRSPCVRITPQNVDHSREHTHCLGVFFPASSSPAPCDVVGPRGADTFLARRVVLKRRAGSGGGGVGAHLPRRPHLLGEG